MIDLEQITEQMKEIALQTGAFLENERKTFHREDVMEKHSHDYVSYVDKNAEKQIIEKLSAILPEAGFIAEEGSAGYSDEEYCWVIDPLDGTTNFIHDNAPYCVSIALRNKQELLAGVVYEVCRKECFWAWKGSRAFLNGSPIHVSNVNALNQSFIALGFPYNAEKYRPVTRKIIDRLYGYVGGLRLQGAAAAELCYIAAGRFDGRIESNLGPWDIAAGALILMQAGGKVTDFSGQDTFYSGHEVLASNGYIHQELLDILKD